MSQGSALSRRAALWRRLTGLGPLVLLALTLALTVVPLPPVLAQVGPPQVDGTGALLPRKGLVGLPAAQGGTAPTTGGIAAEPDQTKGAALDYAVWERLARRAESATANRDSEPQTLDALRSQIVDWRAAFLGAQNANAARIATLRAQISALGPAPVEGSIESEEIANRRLALTEQLVTQQAPGIAAEEAYRRADGLISEIDRVARERQADELLRIYPSPINPANWPEAVIGLTDTLQRIWDETAEKWADPKARADFGDNVPFILLLLALAVGLVVIARGWVQGMASRLQDRASARGRKILALFASLGEVVFPWIGILCGYVALSLTKMVGEISEDVLRAGFTMALYIIVAAWVSGQVFPRGLSEGPLGLPPERRVEARFYSVTMAALVGLDGIRFAAMDAQRYSEGTTSGVSFPGLVVSGLLLIRMGQLLHRHLSIELRVAETVSYGKRLIGFLGKGAVLVGIIGPVLAAVGYVPAADAIIYPAIITLLVVGLLLILQELVTDLNAVLTRSEADPGEALIPVLANFALALASLPVLALIWGARISDLTELWTRFREGFSFGETRISPTNFVVFAAVFAIGYVLTRMFQGAMKNSILPRTSLDQGGQNAIISGLGYIGIFLASLVAINAAGIDLSGLAIVAGALSVGIGFGLQAVVSNFVSGIILLIERPVSEGDWIEVAGVHGTVKSISVRSTRIQTFDRSDVIVPNSDLISKQVTNFTHFNLSGRLIVPVGVAFGSDTRKVEQVLREIAEAQPLAILNPPPTVFLMGFGADAINFEIRVILRDVNFSNAVRSEINHQIVERFAAEGIEIPFAQTEVYLRNADALGRALHGLPALIDAPAAASPAADKKPTIPGTT